MFTTADNSVSSMPYVSAQLTGMGLLGHKRYAMRAERLDYESVCLLTASYLRPWTVFELYLWLDEESQPLYVLATVMMIEQRQEGYYVLASLTGIEQADRERWQAFYHAARRDMIGKSEPHEPRQTRVDRAPRRRILVLGDTLQPETLDRLHDLEVRVDVVGTARQAVRQVASGRYHAVVADLDHPTYDGRALSKELAAQSQSGRSPQVILMCMRGLRKELEAGLALGAHAVISRPQPEGHLAAYLLDMLTQRPLAKSQPVTAVGAEPPRRSWSRLGEFLASMSDTMSMYLRGARGLLGPYRAPQTQAHSRAA